MAQSLPVLEAEWAPVSEAEAAAAAPGETLQVARALALCQPQAVRARLGGWGLLSRWAMMLAVAAAWFLAIQLIVPNPHEYLFRQHSQSPRPSLR